VSRTPVDLEVLVVGGGPAGSTVGGLLARRGHRVLVVDRATFPRPKPCGECLNPGAVAALERLGLREVVESLDPSRLAGWWVGGRWSSARADFGGEAHGLGVARTRLDAALLDEARRRGVRIMEGVRVEEVEVAAGRPRVRVRDGGGCRELRPRVVVGADGLRSRVARSLGLVCEEPRDGGGRISLTMRVRWGDGAGGDGAWEDGEVRRRGRLRVHDGVTVGLAPVGSEGPEATPGGGSAPLEGNLSVVLPADRFGARAGRDPVGLIRHHLARAFPEERLHLVDGPWSSGSFHRPVRRCWAPGVVLVGDAAGYFDPFTGQGIYRALRSAELAADAVDAVLARRAAGRAPPAEGEEAWAPLAAYGRRWTREVTPSRRVQRLVDGVMRAPWMREPALALLGPRSLASIIRVTGDLLPVSSLWTAPWAAFPRGTASREARSRRGTSL